jgi:hypothetical protein
VLRKSFGIAFVLLSLLLVSGAARPAVAFSLLSLDPSEREAMLSTCGRLGGEDQALCRNVVNDHNVVANYKRSCLEAFTLLMRGTAWSRVKSLPPAMTCREGLARAGYPVKDIIRKLASAL